MRVTGSQILQFTFQHAWVRKRQSIAHHPWQFSLVNLLIQTIVPLCIVFCILKELLRDLSEVIHIKCLEWYLAHFSDLK